MEKESNISLGGTIILLTLFAQKYIFKQRYILSRSSDPVSRFTKNSKVKKVSSFTFPGNNKEENTVYKMYVWDTKEQSVKSHNMLSWVIKNA